MNFFNWTKSNLPDSLKALLDVVVSTLMVACAGAFVLFVLVTAVYITETLIGWFGNWCYIIIPLVTVYLISYMNIKINKHGPL